VKKLGLALTAAVLVLLVACGGGGSNNTPTPTPTPTPVVNNTIPVVVDLGPTCSDGSCGATNLTSPVGEADLLFVSVTVCVPGTSTCQTIDHVQVDTGSSGLRLLASQVSVALPRRNDASGNPIGNCVRYLDNTYQFGPVASADIQMAGEVASSVPIQLVGASGFPAAPSRCTAGNTPAQTIFDSGAKGILGVGLFRQDCGAGCVSTVNNGSYFSCPSTGCVAAATTSVTDQLQNPVWLFPQDNNGLVITLPSVAAAGQLSASGTMMFGIATQTDNAVGSAKAQAASIRTGNFTTTFNGKAYTNSYIDSGSNGYFFLDGATSGITACAANSSAAGFYCPTTVQSLSAITSGPNPAGGATVSTTVQFSIDNAVSLFNNKTLAAFGNLGGPVSGSFDWGLPFFFGRTVFVGIENQSTTLGTGPYWAY